MNKGLKNKQESSAFYSTGIFKNMLTLATGSGVAKVIGLISIPFITRIYGPENLGALSIFIAIVALMVPFGSLRYNVAFPLPKSDALALNLVVASFFCLIVFILISTVLMFFFAEPIMKFFSIEILFLYWWLLPVAIFGAGLYELLNGWATREKNFKCIAKTRFWQSFLGSVTKVGLGLIQLKPIGLIVGQIITQSAGVLSLGRPLLIKLKLNRNKITKKRVFFLLRYYREYPIYRLPSQFLLVFSVQSPLLFSAWLFGTEITGQLGLALMAVGVPIVLFGNTTGQAYYAEIAKIGRNRPQKIYEITKIVTLRLFIISIPPFLVLLFLGPWLFKYAFGEEWLQAGFFTSILASYLLMKFVSAPIVNALSVFEKQKEFFYINLRRAVLILIVFVLAYYFGLEIESTLLLFSIVLSLHYAWVAFTIFKVIKRFI